MRLTPPFACTILLPLCLAVASCGNPSAKSSAGASVAGGQSASSTDETKEAAPAVVEAHVADTRTNEMIALVPPNGEFERGVKRDDRSSRARVATRPYQTCRCDLVESSDGPLCTLAIAENQVEVFPDALSDDECRMACEQQVSYENENAQYGTVVCDAITAPVTPG